MSAMGRGGMARWAVALVLVATLCCAADAAVTPRLDVLSMADLRLRLDPAAPARQEVDPECFAEALKRLSGPKQKVADLPKRFEDIPGPGRFYSVENTTCAFDTPQVFGLAKGNSSKLMVFLVGGGGCFDRQTCCENRQSYTFEEDLNLFASVSCLPSFAVFDGAFEERDDNAFAEYSVLYVSYCTGDAYLGNIDVDYGDGCVLQHRGSPNVMIAVDWALDLFGTNLTDLVILGESAGAYGAPFVAAYALEGLKRRTTTDTAAMLPKTTVVLDSGAGAVTLNQQLDIFGNGTLLQKVFQANDNFPGLNGSVPLGEDFRVPNANDEFDFHWETTRQLRQYVFEHYPDNLVVLEVTPELDATQIVFAILSGNIVLGPAQCIIDGCGQAYARDIAKKMRESASLERGDPNYYGLLITNDTSHTYSRLNSWYEAEGILFFNGTEETEVKLDELVLLLVDRKVLQDETDGDDDDDDDGGNAGDDDDDGNTGDDGGNTGDDDDDGGNTGDDDDDGNTGDDDDDGNTGDDDDGNTGDDDDGNTGDEEEPVCFPADALVETHHRGTVPMSALRVGDAVHVGRGVFSDVFLFTHQHSDVHTTMVQLTTSSGATLALSPSHYLPVHDPDEAHHHRLTAARHIQVGDHLLVAKDGAPTRVLSVARVAKRGLYNPQTLHGTIAVDGIVASTFTQTVHPTVARWLLVLPQLLYRWSLPIPFASAFLQDNRFFGALVPHGPARISV